MTYKSHTVLAVVPARGGSKGIPRKNLQTVCGISLVGHAARVTAALQAWLDHRVLSTDDEEIAAEGRRWGLDTPFMRPADLAGDKANSIDMWRHAWLASEANYGMRFDISILLEPTSPLRNATDVERTLATLVGETAFSGAVTVSRTPAHFTPHKTLRVDRNQCLDYYLPEGENFSQRQQIPPYYFRNGICYAVWRDTLVDRRRIMERGSCAAVIVDRPVVNIDEPLDLKLAELLMAEGNLVECSRTMN